MESSICWFNLDFMLPRRLEGCFVSPIIEEDQTNAEYPDRTRRMNKKDDSYG